MKATNINEIPKGWISNSAYTVLVGQEVRHNDGEKAETILDGTFRLIEASKLSIDDEFMKYKSDDEYVRKFKKELSFVIRNGAKDFYKPIYDPSLNKGSIQFVPDAVPFRTSDFEVVIRLSKEYMPERKSRLGTKNEYVAFMGVLIKELISRGWTVADAWNAVCVDSKMLGHFLNSPDARRGVERTGSREVCGFCDLGNTSKIFYNNSMSDKSCYFTYGFFSNNFPLTYYEYHGYHEIEFFSPFSHGCTPWVIIPA